VAPHAHFLRHFALPENTLGPRAEAHRVPMSKMEKRNVTAIFDAEFCLLFLRRA
jgi:hypothetical protein